MLLKNLKIHTIEKPVKIKFIQAIIIIFTSFMLSGIFSSTVWAQYTTICHTILELVCIFISLASFFIVWYSYDRNSSINQIVCFGFLIVAIFDMYHAFYYQGLKLYPEGCFDLTTKYWLLGRLSEAVILLLTVSITTHPKINKWAGLIFSIGLAGGISHFVLLYNVHLPVLFTQGKGVSPLKIAIEYIIITLFLMGLYKLKDKINDRDILTYRYIFLALLIAVPGELCFTVFKTVTSFYNCSGHILKVAYYYYLFRGIFLSAITYPYDKLEEAGAYMKDILNGLPIGIITYDNNLKLTFANNKALDLLDCTLNDIIGLTDEQVHARFSDSGMNYRHLYNNPIKNELICIKSSSKKFIRLKATTQIIEGRGAMYLLTEAKKEQELENLQLQTKTILNAISNTVLMVDTNNKVIMCNKAYEDVTGLKANDLVGLDLNELNELLYISNKNLLTDAIQGKSTNKIHEVSIKTTNGNKKELVMNAATIFNVDGEIIGAIRIGSDVTNIKIEQQRLQQQEKLALLGVMASGIVHEIKNPLTSIKGFSQMIMAKASDERMKQYASIIVDEVNSANKVVTDFLTFAKPQPPVLKDTTVNELVKSMELVLDTQSFVKGVQTNFDLSSDETPIMVDEIQIKQVLLNIVKNAIEAMNETEEPKLNIITGLIKSSNKVFITISDNGKGMSLEAISQIGTPFFSTKDKGTGLGMSICYQIIKEHGGSIEIESELDKGTTFIITLPCKEAIEEKLCVSY